MIYMFLADGFEEVEALCPLDLMRRAGLSVMTVGVGEKVVRGSHGIEVIADVTCSEAEKLLDKKPADAVILPGGMPGTTNLKADPTVNKFIKYASDNHKLIGAICAAPSVLGHLGLLKGRRATCYPGFEQELTGATVEKTPYVIDGRIITGRGAGATVLFARAIVACLCGQEKADEVGKGMMCPDLV